MFSHLALSLLLVAGCSALTEVRVGVLLPRRRGLVAAYQALREINNKTDGIAGGLLPNTELRFLLRDSRRDSLATLVGALELVGSCSSQSDARDSSSIVAAIGAAGAIFFFGMNPTHFLLITSTTRFGHVQT